MKGESVDEWHARVHKGFYWETYIKSPIQLHNGYIAHGKGVYKIVDYRLGRHFSYINISRLKNNGDLNPPIYLAMVGTSWEDTNIKLAVKIFNYVRGQHDVWIDLNAIS